MPATEKLFDDQRIAAEPIDPIKVVIGPPAAPAPAGLPLDKLKHLPDETLRFLNELPFKLSLTDTAIRYPHIVNKLCVLWYAPRELNAYLTEVLVTDRARRKGLDFEAARELAAMREYVLDDLRRQGLATSPV